MPFGQDVNDISLRTLPDQDLFNTGESIADPSGDYRQHLQGNTAFIADIDAALAPLLQSRGLLPGVVTADNAADRATTQSCAGCHQLSSSDNLGGMHSWPAHSTATNAPNAFVHVDELGRISAPLQSALLPHRELVLKNFIEEQACEAACPSTAASADLTAASADAPLDSAEHVPALDGSATH